MIATSQTERFFPIGPFLAVAACLSVMALAEVSLQAQQIKVGTPLQRSRDSYFERQGVDFGFFMRGNSRIRGLSPTGQILPNIVVSQNSAGSAVPQIGGFDPNSQLTTGVGVFGGNGGFSLGLFAGKGSTRSLTSTTPSVVVQNGQVGSIFSGRNRPFVVGLTPVLGGAQTGPVLAWPRTTNTPLQLSSDPTPDEWQTDEPRTYSDAASTAAHGDISIAEIERQKVMALQAADAELAAEVESLTSAAQSHIDAGEYGAARAKFGRALRKIGDNSNLQELRDTVWSQLLEIRDKR